MAKNNKIKPGLGKGLGALISSVSFKAEEGFSVNKDEDDERSGFISNIEVTKIITNTYQPRQNFNESSLEELKNSIMIHGVIQPITVRKIESGYELISGERRLRAVKLAGLSSIPAYILDVNTNFHMLELALIENLQREDLNPIEIANGYHRLIEECSYTQEQVADRVSRDRSTITNLLRLLRLPESIQDMVRTKQLSYGHARALLGINDHTKLIWAAGEIIKNNLSVRQTEQLVKNIVQEKVVPNQKKKENAPKIPSEVIAVLNDKADYLRQSFGTQVKIFPKTKSSGTIEFEFYSADDFERLLELFDKAVKQK